MLILLSAHSATINTTGCFPASSQNSGFYFIHPYSTTGTCSPVSNAGLRNAEDLSSRLIQTNTPGEPLSKDCAVKASKSKTVTAVHSKLRQAKISGQTFTMAFYNEDKIHFSSKSGFGPHETTDESANLLTFIRINTPPPKQ